MLALALAAAFTFPPLEWPRPPLVNPTEIHIGQGATSTWMAPDKDYILVLPKTRKIGSTVLSGGHNVWLIGGEITVPQGDPQQRALYIFNATGTVHIEGVLISNPTGAQFDAIAVNAPQAVVQIERVRVATIYGWKNQWHADLIQPWGGVKEMRVADFTGYTAYQGLQLSSPLGPIGTITLRRTNFVGSGTQVWADGKNGGNGGYLFWGECGAGYTLQLDQAYLKPRAARGPSLAVYPDRATQCAAKVATNGKSVALVKPATQGDWLIGGPAGGDFAPAGSVGLTYQP